MESKQNHSIHGDRLEPILLLEEWIASGFDSAIDNETLSYACLLVAGAMIDHDYDTLSELKNRLTPMASKISRRLHSMNIPTPKLQASGIAVMSSLIRAAFQYLEWNDHVSTLRQIRYGEDVLSVLIKNSPKSNTNKNEPFVLNLSSIEKSLAENKIKLSQATISRCLKLLEHKAFIHLTGSTRSRKCHILHKSWQWYEAANADEKERMKQDKKIAGTKAPPSIYIDRPLQNKKIRKKNDKFCDRIIT